MGKKGEEVREKGRGEGVGRKEGRGNQGRKKGVEIRKKRKEGRGRERKLES